MPPTTIRYSTLPENSHSNNILDAYRANLAESSSPPVEHAPPIEPDATAPVLPRVTFTDADPLGDTEPDAPATRRFERPHRDSNTAPVPVPARIPDSDPRSPRYEPPSLRHKPGDTYEIGGKPHDPLDPGPYGTPDWRQDPRTGRHRRGELPDPRPDFDTAPEPDPDPPSGRGSRADPPAEHPNRPTRRPRPERPHWQSPDTEPPHRFSPMRETAMRRFLELSQPFRDAHFAPQPPGLAERARWVLRWLLWVVACGLVPMPHPLNADHATRTVHNEFTADGAHATHTVRAAVRGPRSATRSGMSETPRQERPTASAPVPYMVAWERHFDARHNMTGSLHRALRTGGVA